MGVWLMAVLLPTDRIDNHGLKTIHVCYRLTATFFEVSKAIHHVTEVHHTTLEPESIYPAQIERGGI
jgi:hypothetical protein